MINNASFRMALAAFNKKRSSVVGCLVAALEAFRLEEVRQVEVANSHLSFHIVGTEKDGPDTALLIVGFSGVPEIESFVAAKNAPGK